MQETYRTLTEKLTEVVGKNPDKVALQMKNFAGYIKYTYQELYDNAQAVACALNGMGVQKGDRVTIVLENRPEWVFIYFGILFAGAIAVPLDPQSIMDDFKYFLENSESKVVFTSQKHESIIFTAAESVAVLPTIVLLGNAKTSKAVVPSLSFYDFLKKDYGVLDGIKILSDDIASIIYTSGTTGKPKGVMLSHGNFYANFRGIEKANLFDFEYNVIAVLPLHHSFPFMVTMIVPIFSGGRITCINSIKREEIAECVQETDITIFVGVPQFFYFFQQTIISKLNEIPFFARIPLWWMVNILHKVRQLTGINLNNLMLAKINAAFGSSLKYFITGGARLDKNTEHFFNKVGFTLLQGYGLTETSPVVTLNHAGGVKIGSVGRVISNVKIKIIDPGENGIGEVVISGPNVMKGYYKLEKETAVVIKEGWFYSGDLGYIDHQGYLFLTGRKKELIILGSGKNISPEEVEAHYLKGKYIKELCVMGVGQDENEKLVAVIVPDFEYFKETGEIDIYNTIKLEIDIFSKGYPLYKCIMGFIISKDDLPRTGLGKLKRHEIYDRYLNELEGARSAVCEEELDEPSLKILTSPLYKTISTIITEEKKLKDSVHLNDHLGM
ncbi:MAG: AMP-binding protein, partial [Gammaproteobacteria bacterium]|nr:AMP-binding protein [Gammaproteobacteria bacterium]